MKSLINPWIIIRWAFVAALFAGTLAISVDQIRERDATIAKMKTLLVHGNDLAHEAIDLATQSNDSAIANSNSMLAGLKAIEADNQTRKQNLTALAEHPLLIAEWEEMEAESKVLVAKLNRIEQVKSDSKTPSQLQAAIAVEKSLAADANKLAARMKVNHKRRLVLMDKGN